MVAVGTSYDPLLKRPFCCFRRNAKGMQFLYAVRGKGTSIMRDLCRGDILNIIGPLGKGYPNPQKKQTPICIAGGTGIASLFSFIEKNSKKVHVIYGARCRNELLAIKELKKIKLHNVACCTDDGSLGEQGFVSDILNNFLDQNLFSLSSYVLYACGPRPMLKAISKIAAKRGLKGYVSLEENMACGFGACLGCAVKTVSGYKRVCKEGPVFLIEEIVW